MEAQPTEKRKIFDIIKSNIKVIIGIIFFLLVLLSFYSWSKFNKDIKKTNLSEKSGDHATIIISLGDTHENNPTTA